MAKRNPVESPATTVRKVPKQQRSRKLVEAIVEAAARVLEDQSGPFTTNFIAERAGVSIGSLYQYFPTANAIMATLIEKHVADEREAAEAILRTLENRESDPLRDLLEAFVNAHANQPRLTARLHAIAPSFNLQEHLSNARDAQAAQIAKALGLPVADAQISAMAVEGVVLATLANSPKALKSSDFIDKLYAIAVAPLTSMPKTRG